MTGVAAEPVLVYSRISQNHRRTLLLAAMAIASILPFVFAVSFGVPESLLPLFARSSYASRARQTMPRTYGRSSSYRQQEFERRQRAALEREKKIERIRIGVMSVTAVAVTSLLGLMFWGVASSATSNVLALCGARPAGAAENEARRLLQDLSIRAGLPPPKLYFIESLTPNAFAAGMDPAHSVVVVTRGLLLLLDHRELECVLAHELSHIGNQDMRLNTMITSITIFLRLPYLMRKSRKREGPGHFDPLLLHPRYRLFSLAFIFVWLYLYVIAPVLAALMRATISRSREYLADADAALLTDFPEGLMRALAKVGGAGPTRDGINPVLSHLCFADPSSHGIWAGLFSGNLLATHPHLEQRIQRLMELHPGVPLPVIEGAAQAGKKFAEAHRVPVGMELTPPLIRDELTAITAGHPMGRVFRVVGAPTPVAVYNQADVKSGVVDRIAPGHLVVVFDDPGPMREVVTCDRQTFGYLPHSVKLERVDLLPEEANDPETRAAAESVQPEVQAAAPKPLRTSGLTAKQITIAIVFAVALFAGVFAVLFTFGWK
jgi:heat shock protein HtpX